MNTYLLTWNPNRWPWDTEAVLAPLKKRGFFDDRWSCGHTKRIQIGDRLFLLRQGREPRGIMASGYARSIPYKDKHWGEGRTDEALYVKVRFDAVLTPEVDGVLPLSRLQTGPLAAVNWRTQASGISIPPLAASKLDSLWRSFLEAGGQSPAVMPEEVSTPGLYFEGATRSIAVNAYERDPRARKACIEHYGATCCVCGFDFAARYGALGQGFILVHHLVPLSQIGKGYMVHPVRDLRPVCPNCHAMLHKSREVLTVDDLKKTLRKASFNNPIQTHARKKRAGRRG